MTPDARLSPAEMAALADLEAAATAADPFLAARLAAVPRRRSRLPSPAALRAATRAIWRRILAARRWALVVTIAGLALVVTGMAGGIAVSLAGAVLTVLGLRMLAESARRRWGPGGS